MIDFIATESTYEQDLAAVIVRNWVEKSFNNVEGVFYYKHPVFQTQAGVTPELTLLFRAYQPIVIRCVSNQIDEIQAFDEEIWLVDEGEVYDSPLLELDDFVAVLRSQFDRDRTLRNRLQPQAVLAFPLISKNDFDAKFGAVLQNAHVIWSDGDVGTAIHRLNQELSDTEWRHVRSIAQGINVLKKPSGSIPRSAKTLGEAIKYSDREIALLDREQENAALQSTPGPQRIRGLAGTGKTVLLAMKAANLHRRYPHRRILFTFNTQSLYNQTESLISRFYRSSGDTEPDWAMLHVRHAWGGAKRSGVYSDLCGRLQVRRLNLTEARSLDNQSPFRVCCRQLLKRSELIQPEYDFILVDEAQDFPAEFFQVLYRLSTEPHRICWAYDELQSLYAEKISDPESLFGVDETDKPRVSLEGAPYPGGIEKDLVLHKSYRCPRSVLMLAHAIGLGLYNPKGPIQMLGDESSWAALGYEVESGQLQTGEQVVIHRPAENSPNPIPNIYEGQQEVVKLEVFSDRDAEFDWIAKSIYEDVKIEGVAPEQVVVICLDALSMKNYLPAIQKRLFDLKIPSTIPGLIDEASAFGEPGAVTLSTVFRTKGSEAYVVYICGFEALDNYAEVVENRNRAFTAISRSKAWVRITGVGNQMRAVQKEIQSILNNLPRFRFEFPDITKIPRLDAETARRHREVRKAKNSVADLVNIEPEALASLAKTDPELLSELIKRINEVKPRENQ
jgi:superfamily I DNA and RNA helicase